MVVFFPGIFQCQCSGAEDEPQNCPADCIDADPDFEKSEDNLMEKYECLCG